MDFWWKGMGTHVYYPLGRNDNIMLVRTTFFSVYHLVPKTKNTFSNLIFSHLHLGIVLHSLSSFAQRRQRVTLNQNTQKDMNKFLNQHSNCNILHFPCDYTA